MSRKKENISILKNCYGCGVCVIGCPTHIIELRQNNEGFYSPVILNQVKCIECGICLDICAFNHKDLGTSPLSKQIYTYGGWSKNEKIRASSTSGGIGYELAKKALCDGIKVCAVKYNLENQNAEHYICESISLLSNSQGTKYLPSDTIPGLKKLNRKDRFIVFGLPCQIDSLRRYVRRFKIDANFILVDLFCYGVPSLLLWQRVLKSIIKKTGTPSLINFRSKAFGWHKSACLEVIGNQNTLTQRASESLFYSLFFTNSCLNKCCSKSCKYKGLKSSADIRIGDFWGKRYSENEQGVNTIITFSQKGEILIKSLNDKCELETCSVNDALEGQKSKNAVPSPFRSIVIYGLRHKWSLKFLNILVTFGRVMVSPHSILKRVLIKAYNGK